MADSETGRRIALRVQIDEQHPATGRSQCGREIDRGRRLADPAFLIRDRNPDHAFLLSFRVTPEATMMRASVSVRLRSSRNSPCHEDPIASSSD